MKEAKPEIVVLAHEVERLRNLIEQLEDRNETLESVNNELVRILTKVTSHAKAIIFVTEDEDEVTKIEEFLKKYSKL